MNAWGHFLRPDMVPWLAGLLIFAVLSLYRGVATGRLAQRSLHATTLGHGRLPGHFARLILQVGALLVMALALLGPSWGYRVEERQEETRDVFLAIDLSTSMLATDLPPDRLQRVREAVTDLVHQYPGYRYELIPFAGDAWVRVPLTLDHAFIQDTLRDLNPADIHPQGTDLYQPLQIVMKQVSTEQLGAATLVLISDGEHNGSRPVEDLIPDLQRLHVKIISVAVGTPEGAAIPLPGGGYARDSKGDLVFSKPDRELLEKLSKATDGVAVDLSGTAVDWHAISEAMQKIIGTKRDVRELRIWDDRSAWLIGLAVFLLLLSMLPFSFLFGSRQFRILIVLGLIPLSNGGCRLDRQAAADLDRGDAAAAARYYSQEAMQSGTPSALHNLGNSLFALEQYPSAMTAFALAATRAAESGEQADSLYNAGNSAVKAGDLMRAIGLYRAALQLHDDEDTRFNLELTKKMLATMQQQVAQQQAAQRQQQQQAGEEKQQDEKKEGQKEDKDNQKNGSLGQAVDKSNEKDRENPDEDKPQTAEELQHNSADTEDNEPTATGEEQGKEAKKGKHPASSVLLKQRLNQLQEGQPQWGDSKDGDSATPW